MTKDRNAEILQRFTPRTILKLLDHRFEKEKIVGEIPNSVLAGGIWYRHFTHARIGLGIDFNRALDAFILGCERLKREISKPKKSTSDREILAEDISISYLMEIFEQIFLFNPQPLSEIEREAFEKKMKVLFPHPATYKTVTRKLVIPAGTIDRYGRGSKAEYEVEYEAIDIASQRGGFYSAGNRLLEIYTHISKGHENFRGALNDYAELFLRSADRLSSRRTSYATFVELSKVMKDNRKAR